MTKAGGTIEMKTERALIRRAVLDYFEGWFDGDVERMDRALHPNLVKRWPGEEHGATLGITTKERMLELTAAGAGAEAGVDRRLEVEIEDVYGDIASVTVNSAAYHEYLHLVRTQDGWKIANALWRPT
jgi:ketosteroid isomerase-like protein